MKKLNNIGWGYRQMLFMTSVLLIFLLIAAYNIYTLYKDMDISDATVYSTLETRLELAASKFVHDNDLQDNMLVMTLEDLSEFITDFEDENKNSCYGYVVYKEYDYKAYIKCLEYQTENYSNIYE